MMKKLHYLIPMLFGLFFSLPSWGQTYCVPQPQTINKGCNIGADINDVTIGAFQDLGTGCGSNGYQDRTSLPAINLNAGATVNFNFTTNFTLPTFNQFYYGIWIDLNRDGDFLDTDEYVWQGTVGGVGAGSFTVPTASGVTRMRVVLIGAIGMLLSTEADNCNSSFYGEFQDYNVLIGAAGCSSPTNLQAYAIDDTSATLAWIGTGSKYYIEYGTAGFTPGLGTLDSSTTNSFFLGGLTAQTDYSFYVSNVCSSTMQSPFNGPYNFTTTCPINTNYPFTENFDNLPWAGNTTANNSGDVISNCWSRVPTFNFNYAWVVRIGASISSSTGPSADASGTGNYMHVTSSGSSVSNPQTAILNLPSFNLSSLNNPVLYFKYHMFGSGIGKLYTEVSSNGGQNWMAIDSLVGQQQTSKISAWSAKSIDVSAFKTSTAQFRMRAVSNASFGDISVDEFEVKEAPACAIPSSINISNIRGDGATVNWTSSANEVYIEYGLQGFTQGTGAKIDTVVGGNSFTITGFPSEEYIDVYLKAGCSGGTTSSWSSVTNFRNYTLPPFKEEFNTYLPDNRWAKRKGVLSSSTTFTSLTNSEWIEDGFGNNGTTGAARATRFTSSRNDWLITKIFDIGANGANWELYFDVALTASNSTGPSTMNSTDFLHVVVSTDEGQTWSNSNILLTLDQNSNLTNFGSTMSKSLAGYSGAVQFGFYLEATGSSTYFNIFLDNIGIRSNSSCASPSNISANKINTTDLWLSWDGGTGVTSYEVEYGAKDYVQGMGTKLTAPYDSLQITNLTAATIYDFYVRSKCNLDSTIWVGPYRVRTACPAVFTTPYFQDFEINSNGPAMASGEFENCWKASPTGNSFQWKTGVAGQVFPFNQTGTVYDHTFQSAGVGQYMYADATAGPDAYLTSGPYDLSLVSMPIAGFYYHLYGNDMGTLHLDVSKDNINWDLDVYSLSGQQQDSATAAWKLGQAPLSNYINDTVYLRFRAEYGTGIYGDMAIDDFGIYQDTGCSSPNGLAAINITSTSADLTWNTYQSGTGVEYGLITQGLGIGTRVGNVSPPYAISGLTPNTEYHFYVRDTCNPTNWFGPYNFSTECTNVLSGNYTIAGPAGPNNFNDLDSALSLLTSCGVNGPVTFTIFGSNHVGPFTFGEIKGASATNTVTFQGATGQEILEVNTSVNYALELNGASYVTFQNLNIKNSIGISAVWLHNNTHHVTFKNCTIEGKILPGGSNHAVINSSFVNGGTNQQGNNSSYISIINNTIVGGYHGISITSQVGLEDNYLVIDGNTFEQVSHVGIRINYVDKGVISNNVMESNLDANNGNGALVFRSSNIEVTGNYFKNNGVGFQYDTYEADAPTICANNIFIGRSKGLRFFDAADLKLYHNSVYGEIDAFEGVNGMTNVDMRNNIFVANTGFAFSTAASTNPTILNYNLYYSNAAANMFKYNGTNYSSLTAWQSGVSSANTNSVFGDPIFVGSSDLHVLGILANDAGDNTLGITVDFDGDTRPMAPSTTVDIGADEFRAYSDDAQLVKFLEPRINCGSATTPIVVELINRGNNTITSMPIKVDITGAVTNTINFNYTGNLAIQGSEIVNLGTINTLSANGLVHIKVYSELPNDEFAFNDTLELNNLTFIPETPTFSEPDTVCKGSVATIYADSILGATPSWFINATAASPVDTGNSFTFNSAGQRNWYLAYGFDQKDTLQSLPLIEHNATNVEGVMFNLRAKKNVEVKQFNLRLLPNAGTSTNVLIYYRVDEGYNGKELSQNGWILHETVIVTSMGKFVDTEIILTNPISIPYGKTYGIFVNGKLQWLDAASVPTTTLDSRLLESTGAMGVTTPFLNINNNKMFNGSIIANEAICSTNRVLVETHVKPDSAIAVFTDVVNNGQLDVDASTSQGQTVAWDFGDGTTASGFTASHTYTTSGAYTVTCVVTENVCNHSDTATKVVNITIGMDENEWARNISIFPNPSNGLVKVSCLLENRTDVTLTVFDGLGREVYNESLENISEMKKHTIDLSQNKSGIYFIHISTLEFNTVKKLVKE